METILKTEYVNCFGEKMTLIMNKDKKLFFKHEDCNEDFEEISTLEKTYEIKLEDESGKKFQQKLMDSNMFYLKKKKV